jgi:hypothetical protein
VQAREPQTAGATTQCRLAVTAAWAAVFTKVAPPWTAAAVRAVPVERVVRVALVALVALVAPVAVGVQPAEPSAADPATLEVVVHERA